MTEINRRQFIRATALLAGRELVEQTLQPLALLKNAYDWIGRTGKETLDLHSLKAVSDSQSFATFFLDGDNNLQKVVEPDTATQAKLDAYFTVNVPWQGKDPNKPDAPLGFCSINFLNGEGLKSIRLSFRDGIRAEQLDLSTPETTFSAIFDQKTGYTFVVNENGAVARVVAPPDYQKNLLNTRDGFIASTLNGNIGGKDDHTSNGSVIKDLNGEIICNPPLRHIHSVKIIGEKQSPNRRRLTPTDTMYA